MVDPVQIVSKNLNVPEWVTNARRYHKKLKAFYTGEGFNDELQKIEGKENAEKIKQRKKHSKDIRDVVKRALNPLENIYTATGSEFIINDKSNINAERVSKQLSSVRDNRTLTKWLQKYWLPVFIYDPAGVMLVEYLSEDNEIKKIYPSYKSINVIRNYEFDGQQLKWILFEPKREGGKSIWRFIDDTKDYTLVQKGQAVTIDEDNTFEHGFGSCPGVINGDHIEIGKMERKSLIDVVLPLLEEYSQDKSTLTLYKIKHGFPIFARFVIYCDQCRGSGKVEGKVCENCNGLGYYGSKDVTDSYDLPIPESKEDGAVMPKDLASYIAPELETWRQYNNEKKLFETVIRATLIGESFKSQSEDNTEQTATGRFLDVQPEINFINSVADTAEWVDNRISNLIARKITGNDKDVVRKLYGRNYIIEPLSALIEKYEKHKDSGVSVVILDRELTEIITAKYQNNTEQLEIELKKMRLEPYVHYDVKTVSEIFGKREAAKKILFNKFLMDYHDQEIFKEKSYEKLKELFNSYINNNSEILGAVNSRDTADTGGNGTGEN